jgi:hypothetical protein
MTVISEGEEWLQPSIVAAIHSATALPYWLSYCCIVSAATEEWGQLEILRAAGLAGGGTREI